GDFDATKPGLQPMLVRNAVGCAASSTQNTSLTVPAAWGSACASAEAVPGGNMCGGVPCHLSVGSMAPALTRGRCAPGEGVIDKQARSWGRDAFACYGTKGGKGCMGTHVCKPKFKPPFKPHVCVEAAGDVACPTGGTFGTKYVYYSDYDDTRACTT